MIGVELISWKALKKLHRYIDGDDIIYCCECKNTGVKLDFFSEEINRKSPFCTIALTSSKMCIIYDICGDDLCYSIPLSSIKEINYAEKDNGNSSIGISYGKNKFNLEMYHREAEKVILYISK